MTTTKKPTTNDGRICEVCGAPIFEDHKHAEPKKDSK